MVVIVFPTSIFDFRYFHNVSQAVQTGGGYHLLSYKD